MSQQQLYTNIFGSADAEDRDVKLKDILNKYPYYSLAHYFLLQQTAKDAKDYDLIAGRTALHFNNPYYLNYLLHNDTPDFAPEEQPVNQVEKVVDEEVTPTPAGPVAEEKDQIAESEKELVFEPLYTTDYFASQGIKLSDEVKADDKLGKQLRSFTDWLKTMKKVHDQKLPAGNAAHDVTVQTIADKSNQEETVITESMADVYKDQGKMAKAREIYKKLSLLDPAKSAYFAAKIDSLKDL
jgi:hypothetical protein